MGARPRLCLIASSIIIFAIALPIALWDWNWFKPMVEQRASAALGRQVRIGHLRVHLAREPTLIADAVEVGNPPSFPKGSRFGSIEQLSVQIAPLALFRRAIVLPVIVVKRPQADLLAPAQGEPNWTLPGAESPAGAKPWSIDIGRVLIDGGTAHVSYEKFKADFDLALATDPGADARDATIRVTARGTYAGQPIVGQLRGGAVVTLRDTDDPYPITLEVDNGPTRLHLKGTLRDPLHFGGADLTLKLRGDNLAALYPLTGVPLPDTAPFRLKGQFDYANRAFRFKDFVGRVGSSDLSGTLAVDPHGERIRITADVHSEKVVLSDLGGFIGGTPGKAEAPNEGAAGKARRAKRDASPHLLPDTPIDFPKVLSADFDVRYVAKRIEGRSMPLNDIAAQLTIDNGRITLAPLKFGVGRGSIASTIFVDGTVAPAHVKVSADFRSVDFGHIVSKTSAFKGNGRIGGVGQIDARGNSLAQMAANGNGEIKLFMNGGEISALLVDLAGFDFGNALLSALGIPTHAHVRCMVTDLSLENGQVDTRLFLFDTTEANVLGKGTVDLKDETIDYQFSTEPKHVNIGSLPAPINVTGPLKNPTILPDAKALGIRGGIAAALGVLATPLAALIPTIQLGLGKDNDCGVLLETVQAAAQRQQRATPAG